jgi:hypothetical protein
MSEKIKLTPQHRVCSRNVEVPTILVEPFNPEEGGELEIFVQWFGESESVNLDGMQFRFPVPSSPDSICWMNHPEIFKVIMFGQVKDWPKKEVVQTVADTVAKGDLEAWIIWLTSSHYSTRTPSGVGPACFIIPMTVVLGDSFGIIKPKSYCDMSVLEEEIRKVSQSTQPA